MRTPVSTWVDDSDAATVETATARTAEPSVDDPSITTSRKGEILRRALVTGEPISCAGPVHLNLILASGKRRGLVVDHRGGDAVTRECCCFLPWVPWKPWLFCACSDSIRTGGTRTACLCCSYSDVVRATYYPSSKAIKIEGCLSCCVPHPFGQHLHVPRGMYGVDAPVASFGCLCPVFRGRERFDLYDDGTIRPAPRPDLVVGRRHVVRDNRLCLVRHSDMQRRLVFSDVLRQAKAGGGKCVCPRCRRKWCGCCRRSSSKPVEPVRVRLRRLPDRRRLRVVQIRRADRRHAERHRARQHHHQRPARVERPHRRAPARPSRVRRAPRGPPQAWRRTRTTTRTRRATTGPAAPSGWTGSTPLRVRTVFFEAVMFLLHCYPHIVLFTPRVVSSLSPQLIRSCSRYTSTNARVLICEFH